MQGNIQKAKIYSDDILTMVRKALADLSLPDGAIVVVVGSLARREASDQSDIDYFVIVRKDDDRPILNKVQEKIDSLNLNAPSPTGAFAKAIVARDLVDKIGGNDESNEDLTRRLLFLLESEWIYGEKSYDALFSKVIETYIKDGITQHQLARFFLNDLIRFYRTMCVDFEYKTGNGGKSWGDRNIKLMFSRKLLYFSGVLAAAQTSQSSCDFKRNELKRLLRMTPLERVEDVCGSDAIRALADYDTFLEWMSEVEVRSLLKSTTADRNTHNDRFRQMKNAGHHFSWNLESLLHRRYAPTHSINQALLF